jgi:phosphoglycolate phosphatase
VHYEGDLANETRPFPGVVEALDALRATGLVLAVATNKPGAFARPLVEALLPGRFAVVLGPDDAGALKPDPRLLRVVEERCGGRVGCYVGDSAVDVDCARAAGVPSIGVTWGLRPDEARQADVVVDDSAALSGAILRLLSGASTEHRRRR